MIATTQTVTPKSTQAKALAWTLGIHALLLLLFFLVRYSVPQSQPQQEELGMEVNLGTDADGSGDDQPESPGDPAPSVVAAAGGGSVQSSDDADLERTDDADAAEIPTPTRKPAVQARPTRQETKSAPNNTTAATANNTTPRRARYVYQGSTGPGGNGAQSERNGTSEGNTTGPGDRGVPGGTPGATNYEGSPGNGTGGIGHTLTGRRIIAPRLEGSFRNGGTVRVRVTVNRDGAIVNSTVVSGTGELLALAREKLRLIRFSAAPDGPVEQIGTLTFVFKTHS
jgi:outer membrane biosynthesis protein TonB